MAESFNTRVEQIESALRRLNSLVETVDYRLDSLGSGLSSSVNLNGLHQQIAQEIDAINREFNRVDASGLVRSIQMNASAAGSLLRGIGAEVTQLEYELRSLNGVSLDISVSTTSIDKIDKIANAVNKLGNSLDSLQTGKLTTASTALKDLIRDLDRVGDLDYNTAGLDKINESLSKTTQNFNSLSGSIDKSLSGISSIGSIFLGLTNNEVGDLGMVRLASYIEEARRELAQLKQDLKETSSDDIIAIAGTTRRMNSKSRAAGKSIYLGSEPTRSSDTPPPARRTSADPDEPLFSRATRGYSKPVPVQIERTSLVQQSQPVTVQVKQQNTSYGNPVMSRSVGDSRYVNVSGVSDKQAVDMEMDMLKMRMSGDNPVVLQELTQLKQRVKKARKVTQQQIDELARIQRELERPLQSDELLKERAGISSRFAERKEQLFLAQQILEPADRVIGRLEEHTKVYVPGMERYAPDPVGIEAEFAQLKERVANSDIGKGIDIADLGSVYDSSAIEHALTDLNKTQQDMMRRSAVVESAQMTLQKPMAIGEVIIPENLNTPLNEALNTSIDRVETQFNRLGDFLQRYMGKVSGSLKTAGEQTLKSYTDRDTRYSPNQSLPSTYRIPNFSVDSISSLTIQSIDTASIEGLDAPDLTGKSPSFSKDATADKQFLQSLDTISAAYGKFTFGASQIGGIFNSFREIAGGMSEGIGRPQGALDVAGGSIGIMHGLQSLNSYFKLGILPKSLEGTFNQRRSETLADVMEAIITTFMGKPGTGNKSLRGGLNPDDKVNEGGRSRGARLRTEDAKEKDVAFSKATSTADTALAVDGGILTETRDLIQKSLTNLERDFSRKLELDFVTSMSGTALGQYRGAGLSLVAGQSMPDMIKALYPDQAESIIKSYGDRPPEGMNTSIYQGDKYAGSAIIARFTDGTRKISEVIAHELTHSITDSLNQAANSFYRSSDSGLQFSESGLETLRTQRMSTMDMNSLDAASRAERDKLRITAGDNQRYKGITQQVVADPSQRAYYFDPKEIFANVGEALLSSSKDLSEYLRQLYGDDLYNSVVGSLQQNAGDVFGGTNLIESQLAYSRFADSADQHTLTAGQDFEITAERSLRGGLDFVSSIKSQLMDSGSFLSKLASQVGIGIGELSDRLDQFGEITENILSNPKRLQEVLKPLYSLDEVDNDTAQGTLIRTLRKELGEGFESDVMSFLSNPTAASAQTVVDAVSNVDIGKVIGDYFQDFVDRDPLAKFGNYIGEAQVKLGLTTEDAQLARMGRLAADTIAPKPLNIYPEMSSEIYNKTGQAIESYSTSSFFDLETGLTKLSTSAKLASGAITQLEQEIDDFGRVQTSRKKDQGGVLGSLKQQFTKELPQEIMEEGIEGILMGAYQIFNTIVGTQDELNELALLFGATGNEAQAIKTNFIKQAVESSAVTGQGYEETIQTNIQNAKLFSFVPQADERLALSSRMSNIQLGAQTVFDLPLEQSMKDIPAIFSQISNGLIDVKDPAERATKAMDEVESIFDKLTVTQRASAANGQNLISIFSELSPSMRKFGLDTDALMSLAAVSDVAIAESPEETATVLKILLERIKQAGQGELESVGIDTQGSAIDVFKQVYDLSRDPTKSKEYETAINALGGQARANQAAKVVQAVGTNYDTVYDKSKATKGTEFEIVLSRNVDAFVGSFNTLQSAMARVIDIFLNSTGIMGTVNDLLKLFSQSLNSVSDFLGQLENNSGFLSKMFTGEGIGGINLADAARFKFIDSVGVDNRFNPLTPVARGINAVETRSRSFIAKALDFAPDQIRGRDLNQRLAGVGAAFTEQYAGFEQVDNQKKQEVAAQTQLANSAAAASNNVIALSKSIDTLGQAATNPAANASATKAVMKEREDRYAQYIAGKAMAPLRSTEQERLKRYSSTPGFVEGALSSPLTGTRKDVAYTSAVSLDRSSRLNETLRRNKRELSGGFSSLDMQELRAGAIAPKPTLTSRILREYENRTPVAAGQGSIVQSKGFQRLAGAGDAVGAMLPGVAMDVMLGGGFTPENMTNIGAGIAGGVAGAFVGGPYGSLVGYTIAKNFAESMDLFGQFGTSEKESGGILEGIKSRIGLTPQEAEAAKIDEETATKTVNDQISNLYKLPDLETALKDMKYSSASSEDLRKADANVKAGRNITDGFTPEQKAFSNVEELYNTLSRVSPEALELAKTSNLSNVRTDLPAAISSAASSPELIDVEVNKIVLERQQAASEAQIAAAEAALTTFERAKSQTDKILAEIDSLYEQKEYQGLRYGGFGSVTAALDKDYLTKINDPKTSDEDRARLQDEYDRRKNSAMSVQDSLNMAVPLSKSLGLNFSDRDMADQLMKLGADGQEQFQQRLRPVVEADQYVQEYEAKQAELQSYSTVDLNAAENAAIKERVATLGQELGLQQDKYMLALAILDAAKAEGNVVKNTLSGIAAQKPRQRVISRGTPAQFVAPDLFNVEDYSGGDLQGALDYARQKQASLTKLNPGYADVFAKEQFMLESNGQFKGVGGINQGFMQEYLQKQAKKRVAPDMIDLSDLSEEKRAKTIARARELQGQAVALAPDQQQEYDKERLMILGKNNNLLMELGLSQEFLRIAMDENTEATEDSVRGHYNLPSSYRPPTVWDYYNNGGTSAGDKNFVPPPGGKDGMVPLSMAQKLAEAIMNQKDAGGGPDLNALGNTMEPGARPMFYPNPGTPSVIENLDELSIGNANAEEVTIRGSSVYINGKDMTASGVGGGRSPDWVKGMLQELSAKSVNARSGGNAIASKVYDDAAGKIQSGEIKDQAQLDAFLQAGLGGMTPATGQKQSAQLDQSTRALDTFTNSTAKASGAGEIMRQTGENAAKLNSNLSTSNQLFPALTKNFLAQTGMFGGLAKQIGATVLALQKLDASKINLNVAVTINGNQAQVAVTTPAPKGGSSGSSLAASNTKGSK